MLSFVVLSAAFLLLGQLRTRGIVPAVLLLALLPFTNSQADYFYRFGLYAYDFYFLSLGVASVLSSFPALRRTPGVRFLMVFVGFIFIYVLFALVNSVPTDKYFLRDLRPVIWAFCMMSVLHASHWFSSSLDNPVKLIRISMLFPIGAMCWQAASWSGLITYSDFYYEQNSYRIFTLGTYFSSVMLVGIVYIVSMQSLYAGIERAARLDFWMLGILCFAAIAVCGFRMPLVAIFAACAVLVTRNVRAGLIGVVAAIVASYAVIKVAEIAGATRVTDALSIDGLRLQLEIRFEPAKDVIGNMSVFQHVVGNGFATTFDVWWFETRELDTVTNFIDSSYLTFYAKYGAVGMMMLFIFFMGVSAVFPGRLRLAMLVMLLVFGFAYSVPYQSMFPGIILGVIFLCCLLSQLADMSQKMVVSSESRGFITKRLSHD